jgi:peptidoglycan/LPS O-acetylase OafA/YrhL
MGLHLCWLSEAHESLLRIVGPDVADLALNARLGAESFFVLSGFMMAHMLRPVAGQDVRLGRYFVRRCYRLLVPFWVAVLIAAADRWAMYLLFDGGTGRPDLVAVVAQLLLVNEFLRIPEPAVGYWSLATLEQFYLLWVVCFAVARLASLEEPEATYRGMGVAAVALLLASGTMFLWFGSPNILLGEFAFYIALGILLYGNSELGLYRWELRTALAVTAAAAVFFQHPRLVAALVAVAVIYAVARGVRFSDRDGFGALRWVGRRSYSVYLVHAVIGIRLLTGFRFLAHYGDWLAVPCVLGAAAASLVCASLYYRWIERPCQLLARRIHYRTAHGDIPSESSEVCPVGPGCTPIGNVEVPPNDASHPHRVHEAIW